MGTVLVQRWNEDGEEVFQVLEQRLPSSPMKTQDGADIHTGGAPGGLQTRAGLS